MLDVLSSPNALLARLSSDDLTLLHPHLERVDLPSRRTLEQRHETIEHVYFIEHGCISPTTGHSRLRAPIGQFCLVEHESDGCDGLPPDRGGLPRDLSR